MADSNVNIRINAQNNASPQIKKVQTDLGGLDKPPVLRRAVSARWRKWPALRVLLRWAYRRHRRRSSWRNSNQSIAMRASFEQMAGGAEMPQPSCNRSPRRHAGQSHNMT